MNSVGLFVPGSSPLHRAPARVKLAMLVVVGALSFAIDTLPQVCVSLIVVSIGYVLAGLGFRIAIRQVRPLLLVLAAIVVFHGFHNGLAKAAVVVGVIVTLVLLAGLVTLTTRTSEMLEAAVAVLRPMRHLGVDPERGALLLALGIRCVPVAVDLAQQVRDAQRARGLQSSPVAFAVPFIVRALRHAEALGDALRARGVDD